MKSEAEGGFKVIAMVLVLLTLLWLFAAVVWSLVFIKAGWDRLF